jgi:hypothetical protein
VPQPTALPRAPFSEVYLQYIDYIDNTKIYDIFLNSKIEGYFRYVDNILTIYKENYTNINDILDKFKSIMSRLNFTLEQEKENRINFLDITIIKDEKMTFNIYRKPTTTDTIIPNDSCHPISYKLAASIYF